jgi:hypothetical protein
VYLTLYEKDPLIDRYLEQRWPDSWQIELVDMRGNGPTYNEMLRRYPQEATYGFLADDAVLDTPGMLRQLERAAGDWGVAYPNDGIWKDGGLATMPCLGGKLVRAAGYLSPPNFVHMGIDSVWTAIGQKLGCLKYLPELRYTHNHPLVGKAQWDKTYIDAQLLSVGHEAALHSFVTGYGMQRLVESVEVRRHA